MRQEMRKEPMQDISAARFTRGQPHVRRYHQARWDEPVIFELSQPGERALLLPEVDPAIAARHAPCPGARIAATEPEPGAAPLPAPVPGNPGGRPERRYRARHLHDEVQPQDQRATGTR